MLKVMPLIVWSSVSLAVYSALFEPFFAKTMTGKTQEQENQSNLLSMVFLGLGEIIGSAINGSLQDRFGSKTIIIVNICEVILAFAVLILYN